MSGQSSTLPRGTQTPIAVALGPQFVARSQNCPVGHLAFAPLHSVSSAPAPDAPASASSPPSPALPPASIVPPAPASAGLSPAEPPPWSGTPAAPLAIEPL